MEVRLCDFSTDGVDVINGTWDFINRMGSVDWVPEDRDKFEDHILKLLSNPAFEIIGAFDDDGQCVAGIGIAAAPFMWNPDLLAVEEIFWWASKDAPPTAALQVLRFATDWAKREAAPNKVIFTMKRMDVSPPGVERIYDRLGLRHTEVSHSGVLG